ncbi:twitching motility protein [Enterobacter hormaechei]|uniref:type IV pilus twitching motility protein PilT n=1 Tax=Enterobacter hormaechei TaxID=158836 RepID=UPI00079B7CF8|nr:ATPase, T2SS/T4P/T4SS family [Enterobacter hormaechei]SAG78404.1 twitching motility protein [Enterobacter hormaechei]
MDVEEIVALSVKHNVSDLHLCSDSPPRWRRSGRLEPAPFPPPDVEALLKAWLNDEQQGAWWANGQVDFAVTLTGGQRLRDSETIRLALTAAETGHLVLATLHTRGAAQAIERLVDTFPAQEKDPVRNQLAGSLRAVLAQKLRQDVQGGRVALYELLVNTSAAANLIREGKTWQLPGIIQTGQQAGMQNFEQSLAERRAQGRL